MNYKTPCYISPSDSSFSASKITAESLRKLGCMRTITHNFGFANSPKMRITAKCLYVDSVDNVDKKLVKKNTKKATPKEWLITGMSILFCC